MYTRKLFTWISVLILASVACQATSSVARPTEPTASPVPSPTDTAIAVEPTATQPPPPTELPTEPPTPDSGSAPVIQSVDLRPETSGNEMTVYQDILFLDADGDAQSLSYKIITATIEDLVVNDGTIDTPPNEQKNGAKITGTWNCGSGNYEVRLRIIVADKKGNQSEASEYTIVCGLGDVQGGFPDLFDDNRNGWNVSERFVVQDGELRSIRTTEAGSYWLSCSNCIVTPDQNSLSVEAWWSNTADASLGLLIDDGTCMTDNLSFIVGPHGYYSVLQAVRDASGDWRHWRPLIDWTKTSKTRRAQNQPNLLTAEYEFGSEDLYVKFSINGSYITRVQVFSYNGAKQCKPGLRSDSDLEAHFDNFSIPAMK